MRNHKIMFVFAAPESRDGRLPILIPPPANSYGKI